MVGSALGSRRAYHISHTRESGEELFVGFRILAQTWYLTPSAPYGFELSNAVEMVLGR